MTKAWLLRIHGRVQGVGYRHWLIAEARRRGVVGWVRNRLDGTVEAMVTAEAVTLDGLIVACHRGPAHALVSHVDQSMVEPDPSLDGFHQRPTE